MRRVFGVLRREIHVRVNAVRGSGLMLKLRPATIWSPRRFGRPVALDPPAVGGPSVPVVERADEQNEPGDDNRRPGGTRCRAVRRSR